VSTTTTGTNYKRTNFRNASWHRPSICHKTIGSVVIIITYPYDFFFWWRRAGLVK
jgi:hypothetical protein